MTFEQLIAAAKAEGASDLHLEGGLPATLRVRGELRSFGEPIPPATLTAFAQGLLSPEAWNDFTERRSSDLSRVFNGVRCRINVLRSARGVGFAVRLLSSFQATIKKLNLHPDLKKLIGHTHGLILVTGSTGSGKSTTLSALLQEINLNEARHIVTIESPIEYSLTPRQSFIRQREVGRDTPSFEQALIDAMREDPDVLMVGEMRDPDTMRLTLNAAETGHLVLATLHSSTCAEALQRIVSAFPAEAQGGVCAQLADCLVGVVAQRLRFRPERKTRVPECEVLMASTPVRANIRLGQFFKLGSALESGGNDGCWSFARYREWLDRRTDWADPTEGEPEPAPVPAEVSVFSAAPPRAPAARPSERRTVPKAPERPTTPVVSPLGVIDLDDADDLDDVVRELESGPMRKK